MPDPAVRLIMKRNADAGLTYLLTSNIPMLELTFFQAFLHFVICEFVNTPATSCCLNLVSAKVQLCKWSLTKLWRSNSILNL